VYGFCNDFFKYYFMENALTNENIPRIIEGLKNQVKRLEEKFKAEARMKASYFDLKNIRRQMHEVYEQIKDLEKRKNKE
jgi:hypothetical protein